MGTVIIGCDLGQKSDPTAIVVAETELRPAPPWQPPAGSLLAPVPRSEIVYIIRYLSRLPLGTPYPNVASRIVDIVRGVRDRKPASISLYVDATGVGTPVVDILRVALAAEPITLIPATFTHGERFIRDGTGARVGKAFLVSRLQALLQTDRIKLPKTAEADTLARELMDYEIKVSEDAQDKYGAFKVGSHDDLVTALGLCVVDDPAAYYAGNLEWR
jgi:hypothetical protein